MILLLPGTQGVSIHYFIFFPIIMSLLQRGLLLPIILVSRTSWCPDCESWNGHTQHISFITWSKRQAFCVGERLRMVKHNNYCSRVNDQKNQINLWWRKLSGWDQLCRGWRKLPRQCPKVWMVPAFEQTSVTWNLGEIILVHMKQ